jgi:hypothetical protein
MKHSPNVLFHHLRNLIALQMTGLIIAAGLIGGCLSGKPSPFPATPIATRTTPAGDTTRTFDIDGDGRGDYAEVAGDDGRVRELRFAPRLDQPGDPFPPSHESADAPTRHLLLILDSIPFELVRAAYARGEFRLFHPPSQVVSPFPAMTDLCLNEFVGTSPAPGVETQYYDGETLSDGWALYDAEANSPWHTRIDWHLPYDTHGKVYLAPRRGFQAELARIEQALADTPVHRFVAYSVGTSALGFQQGAEGHAFALAKLERFCRMLVQRARGRLNITLMSDHGHALGPSRMLDLRGLLRRGGFRLSVQPWHNPTTWCCSISVWSAWPPCIPPARGRWRNIWPGRRVSNWRCIATQPVSTWWIGKAPHVSNPAPADGATCGRNTIRWLYPIAPEPVWILAATRMPGLPPPTTTSSPTRSIASAGRSTGWSYTRQMCCSRSRTDGTGVALFSTAASASAARTAT